MTRVEGLCRRLPRSDSRLRRDDPLAWMTRPNECMLRVFRLLDPRVAREPSPLLSTLLNHQRSTLHTKRAVSNGGRRKLCFSFAAPFCRVPLGAKGITESHSSPFASARSRQPTGKIVGLSSGLRVPGLGGPPRTSFFDFQWTQGSCR